MRSDLTDFSRLGGENALVRAEMERSGMEKHTTPLSRLVGAMAMCGNCVGA